MSGIVGSAGSKSGVIGTTELDYEEGFFNCTYTSGSGSITVHADVDNMRYTKIGRTVYIQGYTQIDSISSPSGVLTLVGLPFTSCANNVAHDGYSGGNFVWFEGTESMSQGQAGLLVTTSATTGIIREWSGTSATNCADKMKASTILAFSFTYTVD